LANEATSSGTAHGYSTVSQLPGTPISPSVGSPEAKVIDTISQWMRDPLGLPEEFRGWLPRFLETTDLSLTLEHIFNGQQSAVPIGSLLSFAGSTAPSFYLLCDGTAVSRSQYSALFSIIGTTYGVGDASTTFNVPNLKGRVVVTRDASVGAFDTLGETGGAATHTLATGELPSHTHSMAAHTHTIGADGLHTHTINGTFWTVGASPAGYTNPTPGFNMQAQGATDSSGSHSHGGATGAPSAADTGGAGSGTAHANLQPYIVTNTIIRAQ
jgi:microcystin-dependent protein